MDRAAAIREKVRVMFRGRKTSGSPGMAKEKLGYAVEKRVRMSWISCSRVVPTTLRVSVKKTSTPRNRPTGISKNRAFFHMKQPLKIIAEIRAARITANSFTGMSKPVVIQKMELKLYLKDVQA